MILWINLLIQSLLFQMSVYHRIAMNEFKLIRKQARKDSCRVPSSPQPSLQAPQEEDLDSHKMESALALEHQRTVTLLEKLQVMKTFRKESKKEIQIEIKLAEVAIKSLLYRYKHRCTEDGDCDLCGRRELAGKMETLLQSLAEMEQGDQCAIDRTQTSQTCP